MDQPSRNYTQKALSFHHVPELSPHQYHAAVRSPWAGQHFSQCFSDAANPGLNRIQIQNGTSALSILATRKQASWPVTPTLPALSLASVSLVPPVAHGYQAIFFPHQNMHPLTLSLILLPTQTDWFVCADTEGTQAQCSKWSSAPPLRSFMVTTILK